MGTFSGHNTLCVCARACMLERRIFILVLPFFNNYFFKTPPLLVVLAFQNQISVIISEQRNVTLHVKLERIGKTGVTYFDAFIYLMSWRKEMFYSADDWLDRRRTLKRRK